MDTEKIVLYLKRDRTALETAIRCIDNDLDITSRQKRMLEILDGYHCHAKELSKRLAEYEDLDEDDPDNFGLCDIPEGWMLQSLVLQESGSYRCFIIRIEPGKIETENSALGISATVEGAIEAALEQIDIKENIKALRENPGSAPDGDDSLG